MSNNMIDQGSNERIGYEGNSTIDAKNITGTQLRSQDAVSNDALESGETTALPDKGGFTNELSVVQQMSNS